jgi:septum formation protein
MALRLSEAKARAVSSAFPDALIIGSDQVATVNGEIYGKPGNHERALSNCAHCPEKRSISSPDSALLNSRTGEAETRGVATLVTFRELTKRKSRTTCAANRPTTVPDQQNRKAWASRLLSRMQGDDPNALVGLPLIALCDLLRNQGVEIL